MRDGVWRLYTPDGMWHDSFESLSAAHSWATAAAITDVLFEPGGLTCFSSLIKPGGKKFRRMNDRIKELVNSRYEDDGSRYDLYND